MIKRVNFTGRKRIPRSAVDIHLHKEPERHFDAAIQLEGASLPEDAEVILEATCSGSSTVQRFKFGTVGSLQPPEDRKLSALDGDNVFFNLKIVDHSQRFGRILGIAERVYPRNSDDKQDAGRRGLLPVEEQNLGELPWKLHFGEHDVTLVVNSAIPGLKDRARWDPLFYSVVYPAVIRMILVEAIDRGASHEDEGEYWPKLWLQFGKKLHPELKNPPRREDDEFERNDWIDDVVDGFSKQHSLAQTYKNSLNVISGDE